MRLVAAALLAGLLPAAISAVPAPVAAQGDALVPARTAPDSTLVPGARAYAFSLSGTGSGSFGVWRVRDARRSLGWEIELGGYQAWRSVSADGIPDTEYRMTHLFVGVGPRLRRYAEARGAVAPFLQTGVTLGYAYAGGSNEGGGATHSGASHTGQLAANAGIGAEWFPLPGVSLSGFTGLGVVAGYTRMEGPGSVGDEVRLGFGTLTTGLAGRIYLAPRER